MSLRAPALAAAITASLLSGPAVAETAAVCDSGRVASRFSGPAAPGPDWTPIGPGLFQRAGRPCGALAEGNPVFDPHQYRLLNPDVAAAGVDPLEHWRRHGQAECRHSSRSFSVKGYLAENPDVAAAVAGSCPRAVEHYVAYGLFEGRPTVPAAGATAPDYPVTAFNPGEGTSPPDRYGFTIYRLGRGAAANPRTGLDMSAVTGLPNVHRVPGRWWGPPQDLVDGARGFTGVQQYGGQFGIGIDSRTVKALHAAQPGAYPLYPIVLGYNPSRYWTPWPGGALKTSLELRIPFAGGENGGGGQVVTYYYVHDKTGPGGSRAFYLGVLLHDTRPGHLPGDIGSNRDACGSGCTDQPIVTLRLRRGSPFLRASGSSAESTATTHPDARTYEFEIEAGHLAAVLGWIRAEVNPAFSPNPADYDVTSWNLNPEVFASAGQDGWVALSGRVNHSGPR